MQDKIITRSQTINPVARFKYLGMTVTNTVKFEKEFGRK
jgi:hypothetical protein